MRHLFSSPLGSCAPPCATTFKRIDLLGIGTMVSGVAGAGATVYSADKNYEAQLKTNEANRQMVEATNQTNKDIANEANRYNKLLQDEQNEWNLQQWNRQNEYNDPRNQVARLKAAGINPYALYGSAGGSVPAGSLTSAPAQPAAVAQMQAPYDIAPRYDVSGLGSNFAQMANAVSSARLTNAQVDKLGNDVSIANAQNQREADLHPWKLRFTENMSKKEGILGDIYKTQLAYDKASSKYRLGLLMGDMRMQSENYRTMQLQRDSINLQNRLAEVQLAYAPRLNDAQLRQYYATVNQIKANIGLINANTLLTKEQKLSEIEKRVNQVLQNNSLRFDNKLKEELKGTTVELAKEQLNKAYHEASSAARSSEYFDLGPVSIQRRYLRLPSGW